jgi:Ca2+-binding RTX toxin-like protein
VGGSGRDGFVFNTAPASGNADVIVGFSRADDTIRLAESVFAALGEAVTSGELKIAATAEAARATQNNDHLIYNTTTGQLYYDADGVGGSFKTLVATLTNSPNNLAFDDFLMV